MSYGKDLFGNTVPSTLAPRGDFPHPFAPNDDEPAPPPPSFEELSETFFMDDEDHDAIPYTELAALDMEQDEEIDYDVPDNNRGDVPPVTYNGGQCREMLDPLSKEFLFNGRNILEGIPLDPWWAVDTVDESTGEITQEIKSYYRFQEDRLFFKTQNKKYFLKKSENYEIRYPHLQFFKQRYGVKIKTSDGWHYELDNPANTISLCTIKDTNEAFIDFITYPAEREKNAEKYAALKSTVFKMLGDVLSECLNRNPDEIRIPHKAISCIFKSNYNKSKFDFPVRSFAERPDQPAGDVLKAVNTFTKRINFGNEPDRHFYECKICAAKPACPYTEQMEKIQADLETQLFDEKWQEYLKRNHGQLPLFKEQVWERG